jgi:hypothetical protein
MPGEGEQSSYGGGGAVVNDWQDDLLQRQKAALIDTSVPNAARVADYLAGRRNNFEADRKAARSVLATSPVIAEIMPAVRAFQQRIVRFLATEAGIRQFLDIGAGLPGAGSIQEIAQSVDPSCLVVWVDSDPMVLSHARALLRSMPGGAVLALDASISDPAAIFAGAAASLDLRRPVAVLVPSTLAFIPGDASGIVSALMAAAPPGSYLALFHLASDLDPALPIAVDKWNRLSPQQITLRSRAEMLDLTSGLELVEPGLVPVSEWRPAPASSGHPVPVYGVVARKSSLDGAPVP